MERGDIHRRTEPPSYLPSAQPSVAPRPQHPPPQSHHQTSTISFNLSTLQKQPNHTTIKKKNAPHRPTNLPRENLNNAIAPRRDDIPSIMAPNDRADALAAHGPVRRDVLGADALVEGPEADTRVVASRDGLPAIFAQRERGDGGGVREHGVCALAYPSNQSMALKEDRGRGNKRDDNTYHY